MSYTYVILINSAPWANQASFSAYQFAQAVIAKGHKLAQVFFYHEGIYHALIPTDSPADEINLPQLWCEFAKSQQIPLNMCLTAAQRRFDKLPENAFIFSGLGQLIAAIATADRLITFA